MIQHDKRSLPYTQVEAAKTLDLEVLLAEVARRSALSADRRTYWLIERGSPAEWWCGTDAGYWTRDVRKVHPLLKFQTKEQAQGEAERIKNWPMVIGSELRVTDHIDLPEPDHAAASSDMLNNWARENLEGAVTLAEEGLRMNAPVADAMLALVRIKGRIQDVLRLAPSSESEEEQKLDRPAQVGKTRFGVGIKWSTVIDRAQREHEYRQNPGHGFGGTLESVGNPAPACYGEEGGKIVDAERPSNEQQAAGDSGPTTGAMVRSEPVAPASSAESFDLGYAAALALTTPASSERPREDVVKIARGFVLDNYVGVWGDLAREIVRLADAPTSAITPTVGADDVDARRYRRIRQSPAWYDALGRKLWGEELDAAVDAAMARSEGTAK